MERGGPEKTPAWTLIAKVSALLHQTREAILDLHSGLFGFGLSCMIHLLVFRGDLRFPQLCATNPSQPQNRGDTERARLGKHLYTYSGPGRPVGKHRSQLAPKDDCEMLDKLLPEGSFHSWRQRRFSLWPGRLQMRMDCGLYWGLLFLPGVSTLTFL